MISFYMYWNVLEKALLIFHAKIYSIVDIVTFAKIYSLYYIYVKMNLYIMCYRTKYEAGIIEISCNKSKKNNLFS